MRLTVLGAWPEAGQACSGYLVEHGGFRLVIDVGYATVPRLLLTHLLPGTDQAAALAAARDGYDAEVRVATADLVLDLP
jgi:hypothetical protein